MQFFASIVRLCNKFSSGCFLYVPKTIIMSDAKASKDSRAETFDDDSILSRSEQFNRPLDNAINQQRMKAWHPILHPEWALCGYLLLAVVFIPVGAFDHKNDFNFS